MTEPRQPVLDYRGEEARTKRDDLAYIAPMALFLALTQIGVWRPEWYPITYVIKTLVAAVLLAVLWKHYTKIRWDYWWLGAIFGVIGVFQWIGTEEFLLRHVPIYKHTNLEAFVPSKHFSSASLTWTFIAIRWAGATLVVPVMEELFWRDFAWRTVIAPNDFKLAEVGEWDWKALVLVSLIFSAVHVQWPSAIIWGLMIGGLLVYTRSLGACIVMHGVTNFLLGLYVLWTQRWEYW